MGPQRGKYRGGRRQTAARSEKLAAWILPVQRLELPPGPVSGGRHRAPAGNTVAEIDAVAPQPRPRDRGGVRLRANPAGRPGVDDQGRVVNQRGGRGAPGARATGLRGVVVEEVEVEVEVVGGDI